MIFRHILLQIFHKFNEERTISAPFHLLKGKRSGQTMQDVGIFKLHKFYGLLPKLSRKRYDEEIMSLLETDHIQIVEEVYYKLTDKAQKQLENCIKLPFDGWSYRGNEHIFFARLSLVVQSLSHKSAGVMSFIPIQKDPHIQGWVRNFLLTNNYQRGTLQKQLFEEIIESLEKSETEDPILSIVINRLSGYKIPGFTWQQLSLQENQTEMDVQLLFIACLHSWLNFLRNHPQQFLLLNQIAYQIKVEIPLTSSAFQTAQLYKKGYTIDQICKYRRLKQSTIEDHLVEIAMNDPQFSIKQFINDESRKDVLQAVDGYQTMKLKVLHEVLPHLSYFQIRLVLAKGE